MTELEQVISYIRVIATEYASVTDATLEVWYNMTLPFVSKKQFGKLYEQALAYRICHSIKMARLSDGNNSGEGVDPNFMMLGGSVSEGETSVSFGSSQQTNLQPDAELALTPYGLQYLSLRKMCVVPIVISGGNTIGTAAAVGRYHGWRRV